MVSTDPVLIGRGSPLEETLLIAVLLSWTLVGCHVLEASHVRFVQIVLRKLGIIGLVIFRWSNLCQGGILAFCNQPFVACSRLRSTW